MCIQVLRLLGSSENEDLIQLYAVEGYLAWVWNCLGSGFGPMDVLFI